LSFDIEIARMRVLKMVKNGFYSSFGIRGQFWARITAVSALLEPRTLQLPAGLTGKSSRDAENP
jgi:hypothetical protein